MAAELAVQRCPLFRHREVVKWSTCSGHLVKADRLFREGVHEQGNATSVYTLRTRPAIPGLLTYSFGPINLYISAPPANPEFKMLAAVRRPGACLRLAHSRV